MEEHADDKVIKARRALHATERLLSAKLAHDDLIEFAKIMMPDPNDPDNAGASLYKPAAFHHMIAQALQEVESGKNLRLLISLPPQHGKSQLASRLFPAWMVGRKPFKNIMLGTYNQDFANEFGDDVRSVIEAPAFPLVFGKAALRVGSRAKDHMVTNQGGKLSFLGRGGAGTGRPADCLPGDSVIITSTGKMRLDDFISLDDKPLIASFDHASSSVVFKNVVAWQDRGADELYEFTTTGGKVLRATGNHRIFVDGRGYTRASDIAHGDVFVRVLPHAIPDVQRRVAEETEARREVVLLPGVCKGVFQGRATNDGMHELLNEVPNQGSGACSTYQGREQELLLLSGVREGRCDEDDGSGSMQPLQQGVQPSPVRTDKEETEGPGESILLAGVHVSGVQEEMPVRESDTQENNEVVLASVQKQVSQESNSLCRNSMPTVRSVFQTEVLQGAVLLPVVCERGALSENDREGEFSLQGRAELCADVSGNVDGCTSQRWESVCRVLCQGGTLACESREVDTDSIKPDSASHRPQSDKQQARELDNVVLDLSCSTSQVERDTVSVVRRVRQEGVRVYDIQVEDTGNFFADEILVHNCFIIDDPLKDAKEAESPTIRRDVWEWFTKVAYTRCHAASAICVIQTRWSEDDLIGRLTDPTNACYNAEEAAKWTYINVPAVFTDPRDEPVAKALGIEMGQPLWPERFTVEHLESARRLNPVGFSALYMGRPTPPEGAFYKSDMLLGYSSLADLPKNMTKYGAGDLAVSPERDADKSCVGNWGVDSVGDLWLLPDLYWTRKAADESVEQLIDFAKTYQWMTFAVEKGVIDRAVGPFLDRRMRERGTYFHIEKFPTISNKGARSLSIRGRMAQGRVHFPTFASWWPAARDQLLKFTGSGGDREDDFADMLAMIGQLMDVVLSGSRPDDKKDEKVIQIGSLRWIKEMDKYKRKREHQATARAGM